MIPRGRSLHEEWKIVDKFDSTYWSGLDVQVYANNYHLDEAIQVNYVISEQVRPYYGYSSYTPDRIYHGSRLINGEISFNYKRDGYLFNLLKKLQIPSLWDSDEIVQQTLTPETKPAPGPLMPPTIGANLLATLASSNLPADVANSMMTRMKERPVQKNIYTAVTQTSPLRALFETTVDGFDLRIIFGANLDTGQTLRSVDGTSYEVKPLEHRFKDMQLAEDSGIATGTGIQINGVEIAGISKTINDDGRPIIETYAFHARDIEILKNVDQGGRLKTPATRELDDSMSGKVGTVGDYLYNRSGIGNSAYNTGNEGANPFDYD